MCRKIRCDGKSWKLFAFWGELNRSLWWETVGGRDSLSFPFKDTALPCLLPPPPLSPLLPPLQRQQHTGRRLGVSRGPTLPYPTRCPVQSSPGSSPLVRRLLFSCLLWSEEGQGQDQDEDEDGGRVSEASMFPSSEARARGCPTPGSTTGRQGSSNGFFSLALMRHPEQA